MKAKYIAVLVVVVVGACVWFISSFRGTTAPDDMASEGKRPAARAVETASSIRRPKHKVRAAKAVSSSVHKAAEPLTEEARREQEEARREQEEARREQEEARRERDEEAAVEDFENLTDKWMVPATNGVTMQDVDAFVAQFRKVPKDRKDECLHRALNLVPDENVMLLAGILMDKSQDKELMELVYNDVLNRSDDVKQPILQQIFKDKEHPCWGDTAWILDVTGAVPKE